MSRGRPVVRLVVDTNVFISSLFNDDSPPSRVVSACRLPHVHLIISGWQSEEIMDVFARPAFLRYIEHRPDQLSLINLLVAEAERVDQIPLSSAVRDPKDIPILAAAIVGSADYLVTGDNDLLVLQDDPAIGDLRIVTPREFVDMMDEET